MDSRTKLLEDTLMLAKGYIMSAPAPSLKPRDEETKMLIVMRIDEVLGNPIEVETKRS